jgi:hypothetical protein
LSRVIIEVLKNLFFRTLYNINIKLN